MTHRWTTSLAALAFLSGATAASADTGALVASLGVTSFDAASLGAMSFGGRSFGALSAPSTPATASFVGPVAQHEITTLEFSNAPVMTPDVAPRKHVVDSALWGTPSRSSGRMKMLASPPIGDGALVFGLGTGGNRRRATAGTALSFDHTMGGSRRFEFGWLSDAGWRLTAGWTSSSGGARRSGSRLLDLAAGSRPRENGARVTLAFADRSRTMSYGLTGGSATLSATDAHDLGRDGNRHDAHASLFWLTRF